MRYTPITKQYLTLREAQEKLTFIKPMLVRLMKLYHIISLVKTLQVQTQDQFNTEVMFVQQHKKLHKLHFKFFKTYEALIREGVVIKDASIGLIDFYTIHKGKEVFLCYKMGEQTITHWHEIESGYINRKPVEQLHPINPNSNGWSLDN